MTSVAYQYRARARPAPGPRPARRSTAPFSCSWATPATGTYDLRATATDGVGKTTTSAVVSSPPGRQHDPERGRDDQPRHAAARHRDAQRHGRRRRTRAWPRCASSTSPAPAAPGARPAPTSRRRRRSRARGTPRRSPTAATTCAPSRSTSPATCAPRRRSPRGSSTTPARSLTVTSPGMFRAHHDGQRDRDRRHRRRSRVRRSSTASPAPTAGRRSARTPRAPYSLPLERRRAAPTAPTTCARSPPTRSATRARRRSAAPTSTTPARPAPTSRAPTAASTTGSTPATRVTFTYSEAIAPASILAGWNGAARRAIRVRVNNNGTHGLDGVLRRREHDARSGCSPPARRCRSTSTTSPARRVFNATIVALGLDVHGHDRLADLGHRHDQAPRARTPMVWQPSSQATSLADGHARAGRRRSPSPGANGHRLLDGRPAPPALARLAGARAQRPARRCSRSASRSRRAGEGAPKLQLASASGALSLVELQGGRRDLPRRRDAARRGGQRLGDDHEHRHASTRRSRCSAGRRRPTRRATAAACSRASSSCVVIDVTDGGGAGDGLRRAR